MVVTFKKQQLNQFEHINCLSRKDVFCKSGIGKLNRELFTQSNLEISEVPINSFDRLRKVEQLSLGSVTEPKDTSKPKL